MLLVLGALLVAGCSGDRPPKARGGTAAPTEAVQPATPEPASPYPRPLVPGEPREGDLSGGEQRVYPVELAAGDYARFYAEQRLPGDPGIDLVVTLLSPDGGKLDEVDSPGGSAGGELLSAIAAESGTYRLVLTAADPAAPRGRFTVVLDERRTGRPGDATRITAEKLINEARQLRTVETEEADTEALDRLGKAVALASKTGDAPLEGDAQMLIGQIHLTRGRLEDARHSYDQALAAYDRAADLHRKAIAYVELGVTSRRSGRVEEALDYYRTALPILHRVGDVAEEANTFHSMGVAAMSLGTLEQAKEWLESALTLWRGSADLDGEATALISLSRLELRRGRIDDASEYIELALNRSRRTGVRATQVYCLTSLAGIQRLRGDFQDSLSSYQEALKINKLMGNAREEARVLNNVGLVYLDLGGLDLARSSFEKALKISSRLSLVDSEVQALCNLGSLKARQGDTGSALVYYEDALPRSRQLPDSFSEAVTLRLIGETQLDLGKLDDAIENLDRALALQLGARDFLGEAVTRVILGDAHLARGDTDDARLHLERGLELSKELKIPLLEPPARLGVAKLASAAGNLKQARSEMERAVTIYEELRSSVMGDQLRTAFFTRSRSYYEYYLDLLMEMARREPTEGYAADALAVSERARARGLLDLLAEARIDITEGVAPETREEERRLQGRIRATELLLGEALSRKEPTPRSVDELRTELERREDERSRLEVRIQRESPRYAELQNPPPLGLAGVQGLLSERQAFLEFSVGAKASHLFVVTQDRFATFDLPAASDLQEEVHAFRAAITSSDRRARGAYVLSARKLYDLLIAPAEAVLEGKTELLIAADASLYYLSFEALLTRRPTSGGWDELPYLLRDRSISYVPSASVLATLEANEDARPRKTPEKDFVAFADPDYGAGRAASTPAGPQGSSSARGATRRSSRDDLTEPLPRLVESAREVRLIAEMFGDQRSAIYLQDDATEDNVKASPYLGEARWVHFATHGLIDEERPERSGLALTPVIDPTDPDRDGVLRVGEIFNLPLRADLVVLSACDSGLGKVLSGEGMLGLTRAFLYAGAESLVVTLWEVEDRSTASLMVAFKRHLDRGAGKAEALRQAKLELIALDDTSVPRLWAPFVLVGARE